MCADGANDAPALRQAQMGVAVSTATDVAKSAAGIVLTKPELGGIVDAVKEGRSAFQRILTYTLNSVTKKIVNMIFLTIGLIVTGHAILTPMLMVIIMITGDFLGMSVTTDNGWQSSKPNRWQIGKLTLACTVTGGAMLAFCTGVLLVGKYQPGRGHGPESDGRARQHRRYRAEELRPRILHDSADAQSDERFVRDDAYRAGFARGRASAGAHQPVRHQSGKCAVRGSCGP